MSRPLPVAFVIDRLAAAGTERQLVALIDQLDRRAVTPHLVLLDGQDPESRRLEPKHCPVLRLGISSFKRPRAWSGALRFVRYLRQHRIAVVQLQFPDSTYFGAPLGWLAGARVVRTRRDLGYWASGRDRWLGWLWNRLFVSATVANCRAAREAFLQDERPRPQSVCVIENGVDLTRFETLRGQRGAGTPPSRVVLVANLRPVKSPELFVRAAIALAARWPSVSFELAGDGPLGDALAHQVAEAGMGERIRLRGSISDIPSFLADRPVVVLCSQSEGLSNALIEAMAAGCPIVATRVGGTPELIDEDRTGLLVPPHDASALTRAIDRLLVDPALADRLASQARREARARFAWPVVAGRYLSLYGNLVGRDLTVAGDTSPAEVPLGSPAAIEISAAPPSGSMEPLVS